MAGTIQAGVNSVLGKVEQGVTAAAGVPSAEEQVLTQRRKNLSMQKLELAEERVKERQEILQRQKKYPPISIQGTQIDPNTPAYNLIMKQLEKQNG